MRNKIPHARRLLNHAVLAAAVAATLPAGIKAAPSEQFDFFFSSGVATGANVFLGGFDYDPTAAQPTFYTITNNAATQGIRKIAFDGTNWNATLLSGQTDWLK